MSRTVGPSTSLIRTLDFRRRLLRGQRETKDRPAAGTVLRLDPAAVRFHDAATDREAQPGSTGRHRPASIELLEHALLVAGGEPRSAIGHLHDDSAVHLGR